MIWMSLVLLVIGVCLSAFFSGSETGFYRASRVRIVMDALDGNWLSKFLLSLTNRPPLFVATALIGNNLANYITSMAVVLAAGAFYPNGSAAVELIAPILMSPFLYVYGESLPKNIFFLAPNRLLKLGVPFLLTCTILFSPIALVLWGLAKLLEKLLGESPDKVRLILARKEIQKVLAEGEEAGILHPTQHLLAQNFFIEASRPVGEFCTPIEKANTVAHETAAEELIKVSTRKEIADVPVYANKKTEIIGYYRMVELHVQSNEAEPQLPELHELPEIHAEEMLGEALMQMQAQRKTMAKIIDADGETVGILNMDQLTDPLLKGPLLRLRR